MGTADHEVEANSDPSEPGAMSERGLTGRAGLLVALACLAALPGIVAGAPQIVSAVEYDATGAGPGSVEVVFNETVVAADDGQPLGPDDVVFTQFPSDPIDDVGDPGAGDVYRVADVVGESSTERRILFRIERYNATSGTWEPYEVPPSAGLEINLSAIESTATGDVVDPAPRPVGVSSWDVDRTDLSIDAPASALPVKEGSVLALDTERTDYNVTVFDASNGTAVFGPVDPATGHAAVLDTSGYETGRIYRVEFRNSTTAAIRYVNVSGLDLQVTPNRGTVYLGDHHPIAGLVDTNRTGRPGETVSGRLVDGGGVPVESTLRSMNGVDSTGFRNLTFLEPVDIPRDPVTGTYTIRVVDDLTRRTAAVDVTVECGRISEPTLVDDPGCYVVNTSVSDSTAGTVLEVTASNVSVDGQGNTIDGVDTAGTVGVEIGSGNEQVAVRNLTVRDFGLGLVSVNASRVGLANVEARSNPSVGILTQLGARVFLDGGAVVGNGDGVAVDGTTDVDVEGTVVDANAGSGILIQDTARVNLSTVSSTRNGGAGVGATTASDLRFDGVTASDNGASGLLFTNVTASSLASIDAENNTRHGVAFNRSDANQLFSARLRENGGYGLSIGGSDAGSHDNVADSLTAVGNARGAVRMRGPGFDPSSNNSVFGVDVGSGVVGLAGTYVAVNTSLAPPGPPGGWYGTDNYAHLDTFAGVASQAQVALQYADGDIAGVEEASLALLQHAGGTWNETGSTLNTTRNFVSTTLSTPGELGVLAEQLLTAPELSLSRSSIAFGETVIGRSASAPVTVINTGNATMSLGQPSVSPPGAPFGTGGLPDRLRPGESADLTVAFAPDIRGSVSGTLTVPTNASDGEVGLSGTGVDAGAAVAPDTLDFGTVLLGDTAAANVTVTNTGNVTLDVSNASLVGQDATAFALRGALPTALSPGTSANLSIGYEPAGNGSHAATLLIDPAGAGVETPEVALAGQALDRSLAVATERLTFGDVPPGTTVTETLQITNVGAEPIDLAAPVIAGRDAAAFGATTGASGELAPGASLTLDVRYMPDSFGTDQATLGLADRAGVELATVALGGTGRAGRPVVTPRSIAFANATPGQTSNRTVLVENGGNAPLAIEATDIVGDRDGYGVRNGGAFTLAPGEERQLVVTLTPPDTEPSAGLLRLVTNDTRLPNPTVYLTNTDTAALATVSERDGRTDTNVTVRNATAGDPVTVPVVDALAEDGNLSVSSIILTTTRDASFTVNVTASADPLPTTPTFRLGDGTSPLGHLSIDHSLSNDDIAEATFAYRVRTEPLDRLQSAPGDVSLYRFEDGKWVPKPTEVRGDSDAFVSLLTTADGLSEWTAAARKPRFNVSDTATSIRSGVVGDEATIRVFVSNTGGADGVYVAELILNGEVVDRQEATIPDGGKRALNFERSFDQPGLYEVRVNDVFVGEVTISEANGSVDVRTTGTAGGVDGDDGGDVNEEPPRDGGGGLPVLPLLVVAALAVLGVGAWLVFGQGGTPPGDGPVDREE